MLTTSFSNDVVFYRIGDSCFQVSRNLDFESIYTVSLDIVKDAISKQVNDLKNEQSLILSIIPYFEADKFIVKDHIHKSTFLINQKGEILTTNLAPKNANIIGFSQTFIKSTYKGKNYITVATENDFIKGKVKIYH
jgi:hypothetical protein